VAAAAAPTLPAPALRLLPKAMQCEWQAGHLSVIIGPSLKLNQIPTGAQGRARTGGAQAVTPRGGALITTQVGGDFRGRSQVAWVSSGSRLRRRFCSFLCWWTYGGDGELRVAFKIVCDGRLGSSRVARSSACLLANRRAPAIVELIKLEVVYGNSGELANTNRPRTSGSRASLVT
jgi:hypothetical protein